MFRFLAAVFIFWEQINKISKCGTFFEKVRKTVIRQIHILFKQRFGRVASVHFQVLTHFQLMFPLWTNEVVDFY